MKTSSSILGVILIVAALAASTAVTLFMAAAPYLLLLAVAFAIGRTTRHRATPPTAGYRPGPLSPSSPPAVGGGGWVLVPVWLGPDRSRRPLPVLDAEVIDDGRPNT